MQFQFNLKTRYKWNQKHIQETFDLKSKIGKISKDSTNPFFKSKYFDINALLENVEPLMNENGLLLLQPILENKVYSRIYDIDKGEF